MFVPSKKTIEIETDIYVSADPFSFNKPDAGGASTQSHERAGTELKASYPRRTFDPMCATPSLGGGGSLQQLSLTKALVEVSLYQSGCHGVTLGKTFVRSRYSLGSVRPRQTTNQTVKSIANRSALCKPHCICPSSSCWLTAPASLA